MLFNSWAFFIFFPTVVALYFLLPLRFRNFFLLVASCVFYMSYIPQYILILFFLITLDYILGLVIEGVPQNKKKAWLVLSIAANVLTLLGFKYSGFFAGHEILLPIGLSFHTMQSMSYVIEVSCGRQTAERNYLTYALYVMFFPQLVAGPIERPQKLLPQFHEVHQFDLKRVKSGLILMLLGLYKKVVISNFISVLINPVYKNPLQSSGTDFLLAALTFSIQLYCDFSGYSDIARGAARVLGFELSENFNQPFRSSNLADLWRRWHMTLTGWFRDYVYIPLGGNRHFFLKTFFNIMLVFILSGLWHGTGLNFIMMGALNGLMVALLYFMSRYEWWRSHFNCRYLGTALTFLYFSLTMIFFRSANLNDALYIVSHLFDGGPATVAQAPNIALTVALILSLEALHLLQRNADHLKSFLANKSWLKWAVYYVFAVSFIVLTYLSVTNQNGLDQPFIYFQF